MKNMIFAFESDTPKYKQIYEQFKTLIEQGNIQADERLPSIRELADSLRVSRNTTLMAYDLLLAEGYIRGETRKGYLNILCVFLRECIPPLKANHRPSALYYGLPAENLPAPELKAAAHLPEYFPAQSMF